MTILYNRLPLFSWGSLRAVELSVSDIPALQHFFEANPGYFIAVNGQPPGSHEAYDEFHDLPPVEITYSDRLHMGFVNEWGELIGMAGVLSDFMVPRVWHIGLFMISTSLHGSGAAISILEQLEAWMRRQDAEWIRLGVVAGNARAERFWEKLGYVEVRKRFGVEMGSRVNTLRVMVKPLAGGELSTYLEMMVRDQSDYSTELKQMKIVETMQLVWPAEQHLASYAAALEKGWSADNVRGAVVAREELERIAKDPAAFLRGMVDREAQGGPITMPDGSTVPRLPGFRRWMWDGEFCGSIGFRWQPGTTALPPHCLGHIGYAVVPWKQRRGYATQALAMLLPAARAEGLPYVEITTDPHNLPSQRVIQANGGVLVERFIKPPQFGSVDGLRYRIAL